MAIRRTTSRVLSTGVEYQGRAPITNKLTNQIHTGNRRVGYGDEESESHKPVTGCTEQ